MEATFDQKHQILILTVPVVIICQNGGVSPNTADFTELAELEEVVGRLYIEDSREEIRHH